MSCTLRITEGEYKDVRATGKNEAAALKNLKAKVKRMENKKVAFTAKELDILTRVFDAMVHDEDCHSYIENDDYFGLTSIKQADDLFQKLLTHSEAARKKETA
tara:strand:- start:207 stop:515 length:309 start_codon:yes stop_codon:yes gene_type:complete